MTINELKARLTSLLAALEKIQYDKNYDDVRDLYIVDGSAMTPQAIAAETRTLKAELIAAMKAGK